MDKMYKNRRKQTKVDESRRKQIKVKICQSLKKWKIRRKFATESNILENLKFDRPTFLLILSKNDQLSLWTWSIKNHNSKLTCDRQTSSTQDSSMLSSFNPAKVSIVAFKIRSLASDKLLKLGEKVADEFCAIISLFFTFILKLSQVSVNFTVLFTVF